MAQRKDSPNRPVEGGDPRSAPVGGGGKSKSAGKGGGRSDSRSARTEDVDRNSTVRREKASPSGRERGETSTADRA